MGEEVAWVFFASKMGFVHCRYALALLTAIRRLLPVPAYRDCCWIGIFALLPKGTVKVLGLLWEHYHPR